MKKSNTNIVKKEYFKLKEKCDDCGKFLFQMLIRFQGGIVERIYCDKCETCDKKSCGEFVAKKGNKLCPKCNLKREGLYGNWR